MDNKKLIQILLRDITDLQELITGMKTSGHADPLDLELLDTKMAAIRHLMEVIADREKEPVQNITPSTQGKQAPPSHPPVTKPGEPMPQPSVTPVIHEEIMPPSEPELPLMAEKFSVAEPTISPDPKESHTGSSVVSAKIVPEQEQVPDNGSESNHYTVKSEPIHQPEPNQEPVPRQKADHVAEVKVTPTSPERMSKEAIPHQEAWSDNEELELEETAPIDKQAFGEKFVQGKSVNDLLLEQARPDSKFSNMPVQSLQAVIGINDRFLFTRELFDGNGERFSETIKRLDAMGNLHDAATFLRENYKWKKTETSLKFIDLVKRRFI